MALYSQEKSRWKAHRIDLARLINCGPIDAKNSGLHVCNQARMVLIVLPPYIQGLLRLLILYHSNLHRRSFIGPVKLTLRLQQIQESRFTMLETQRECMVLLGSCYVDASGISYIFHILDDSAAGKSA